MRREVDEVYDPCNPDYDWSNDGDDNIVTGRWSSSATNEWNFTDATAARCHSWMRRPI